MKLDTRYFWRYILQHVYMVWKHLCFHYPYVFPIAQRPQYFSYLALFFSIEHLSAILWDKYSMWCLQFHFICNKLFTSFIVMTFLCFFRAVAYSKQREFSLYIIAIRLLLNHSLGEWFSSYKKQQAPLLL